MNRRIEVRSRAGAVMLAAALASTLVLARPAVAQSDQTQPAEQPATAPSSEPQAPDESTADAPPEAQTQAAEASIDPGTIDWSVLNADAAALATGQVTPRLSTSGPAPANDVLLRRTDRPDGSAALQFGRRLPTEWDTRVGMDVGVAAPSPAPGDPLRPAPASRPANDQSGAAWASVAAPVAPLGLDNASVTARADPLQDQGRLATTLSRSVPIGGTVSVTVQDTYSLTHPLPGSAAPTKSIPSKATPSSVWLSDQSVKFNFLPTGTTLSAGTSTSSANNQRHNSLSAEQSLFGPLNVTTSITDPGTAASSKSITAGFKYTW